MRYHYEKPPVSLSLYGITYICDHPVYNNCTLYLEGDRGLAVIQQRYDPKTKMTWWGEIDEYLTDAIYLNLNFKRVFEERSGLAVNGVYPTVSIRQVMWALRMKPLPREPWETYFDRKNI